MTTQSRFDDRRMRDESLKAFVKALHTDRMVAITGVLSTEALGYPSWDDFVMSYALIADKLATEIINARGTVENERISTGHLLEEIRKRAISLVEDVRKKGDTNRISADRRVSMWTLHELFRTVDREMRHTRAGLVIRNRYQSPALDELDRRVGAIFLSRRRLKDNTRMAASIRPLIRSLGIKRFATLNYDLELERAFMLRHDERLLVKAGEVLESEQLGAKIEENITAEGRKAVRKNRNRVADAEYFASKHCFCVRPPSWPASDQETGVMASVATFVGPASSGKPILSNERARLSRTMGDGIHVESDVVDRERPDRLFELAIGSAEISRHILHLHGRADRPGTMVANIRQYDRLYRLDDLYRDPFDHGLRMLIGGNPILFLGIGMTEAEINDQLQYFVSNTPIRRPAPIFVIWNRGAKQRTEDGKKRPKVDREWERYKAARRLDFRIRLGVHLIFDDDFISEGVRPADDEEDTSKVLLPKFIDQLPELVKRVDRRSERHPDQWRSIERRLKRSLVRLEPCRMWGSDGIVALHERYREDPRFVLPEGPENPDIFPPLVFAASDNGFGRGELSEYIARTTQPGFRLGNAVIAKSSLENRLVVNAGFSYDSDAMLAGIARFLATRALSVAEDAMQCREKHFANGDLLRLAPQTLVIINGADRFFGIDGAPLSAEFDHFLRCVKEHAVHLQVLLLCTARMRRYARTLGYPLEPLATSGVLPANRSITPSPLEGVSLNSSYLEWVAQCFHNRALRLMASGDAGSRGEAERRISKAAEATIRRAETVDREAQKRAFFEAYLSPPLLRELGINCPATFEALRTLSFIGTPVEGVVLLYAPKVRAMLAERDELTPEEQSQPDPGRLLRTDAHNEAEIRATLAGVLSNLCDLGLLIVLDPHDPSEEFEPSSDPQSATSPVIEGGTSAGESPVLALAAIEAADAASAGIAPTSDDLGSAGREAAASDDQILWRRYGMHRSLATFLRDRHGAPINDAKLATTFNMSMFMSEPSDATTPETTFHDELGNLADTLVGAWHDIKSMQVATDLGLCDLDPASPLTHSEARGKRWVELFSETAPVEPPLGPEDLYVSESDRERAIENLPWHAHRDAAACLRAALSVVRGYYSTGALLRFDRSDRIAKSDRDGALTEHAHRLDRLISVFGDVAVSRSILQRTVKGIAGSSSGDHVRKARAVFEAAIGSEPFYADDLVWLFNERGTVALAQGHLFEARDALSTADRINAAHVEKGHHGHNWRRIALGRVGVRIERGSLKPAERLLDEIEVAVNAAPWCKGLDRPHVARVTLIRELAEDDGLSPLQGNANVTREEIFIVAMTTGYRGLVAHLRGRYHEARDHYMIAVSMLRRLGEQRACAHFQRHWATLEGFFGDKATALREIEHAIVAAQASRQMDILHRSRVVRADLIREDSQDETKRRNALQDIKEALRYAALADCYRVRIEASASLARHMRIGGDYDTALRYGVDAMTIAARYGHSLQKTSLRIELGRILESRGDPVSGRALLDQAIAIGTSKGHNHALERVRRALNPRSPDINWTYLETSG